MDPQQQIVEALNNLRGEIGKVGAALERNSNLLTLIESIERDKQKKIDMPLAKEIVIDAFDEWESPSINNAEYNRAKIFLNCGFTPAHTGGISVNLYYQDHNIAEVLRVISSNGSTGAASQAFDVAHLSNFKFIVKNHDTTNTTKLTNFKIVMYKEDI